MTLREIWKQAMKSRPASFLGYRLFDKSTDPGYLEWEKQTIDEVETKPRIVHDGIDENDKIRRYITLPKFLDLLVNRRLLLPKLGELIKHDPYECNAKPDYNQWDREKLKDAILEREMFAPDSLGPSSRQIITNLGYLNDVSQSLEECVDDMTIENLLDAAWFVEYARLKQELCCGCWYGSSMDSDAMWRLYCGDVGVAITTSIRRLKETVRCFVPKCLENDVTLTFENVYYDDTESCNGKPPWLIKRKAFRHEHEIRSFIDYPLVCGIGFYLFVDPVTLIERVEVTPYAQKWESDVIEATINAVLGVCPGPTIQDSPTTASLIEISKFSHRKTSPPEWPKAVNDYFFSNKLLSK